MRNLIYPILVLIFLYSCEKSDEYPTIINGNLKHHILPGYDVTSIAFDNLGNAWIGTYNAFWPGDINEPKLIKYNINTQTATIYDDSNSLIKRSTCIWDIAVDSKNNIWIGSDGLIKFDGVNFTKYSPENTVIPINYIHSISIDSKDNIWFAASTNREGGLVKYDGTNWTVYTPDNSNLPMNGILSTAIDKNDNIWLAQQRYLGETCLVKISNDTWTVYTSKELGFTPAYWGNIQINSENKVCAAIDYTVTNPEYYNPSPQMIFFDGIDCKLIQNKLFKNIKKIAVDSEDNIWCKIQNGTEVLEGSILAVYNGKKWQIDSLSFKNNWIETMALSKDNNIWIGTSNGIYIND